MRSITHATQIGAILSTSRKALKLSQSDVASKMGLSQNRLSELESRPETLTVAQLLALLNLLGLELTIAERTSRSRAEW
jgi:HTH-type transcriptional regulator / antitoxin HipB